MPVAGPPTRVMRSSFAVARLPTSLAQILLVCSTWAALFFLLWPVHSSSNVGNASSLLLHRGEASGIGVVNSTLKGPGLFTQLDGLEGASISDAVHLASHCLQQQKRATEQRRRQQQLRDQHLFPGLPQDFDAQVQEPNDLLLL